MKSRIIIIALIALSLVATAFAMKKPATPTEAVSLEEALSAKKPVAVLFHNSKVCRCQLTKCVKAIDIFKQTIEEIPGDYIYLQIDLSTESTLGRSYEVYAIPVVIFFDKDGAETSRLRVNEVTLENLKLKFGELAQAKTKGKKK